MDRALALAERGVGRTHPNPPVGAVVVRDGRVVGEGFHRRAGLPHAEVEALRQAGNRARGATLYVTLEPCSHFGRTPPCTRAVLAAGIRRVVVGSVDPNPRERGRGMRRLRRAGLEVSAGVRARECRVLIEPYATYITAGRPLVALKLAASLDGRIAVPGESRGWLSGPAARALVHGLRDVTDAVLVGAGTVLADDPRLTCRLPGGRDPIRVVLDGRLRTPPRARVVRGEGQVWVVGAAGAPASRAAALRAAGAEVILLPGRRGRVAVRRVLRALAARGITSLLVEGGSDTAAEFLAARAVDRLLLLYSPIIIGGGGVPMLGKLPRVHSTRGALRVQGVRVLGCGPDLVLEARPYFGA